MFLFLQIPVKERIDENIPYEADCECEKVVKTINAEQQEELRAEKQGRELGKTYAEVHLVHRGTDIILKRNAEV